MVLKEKDSTDEKLNDLMIFLIVHSYAFHMTVMKLSCATLIIFSIILLGCY